MLSLFTNNNSRLHGFRGGVHFSLIFDVTNLSVEPAVPVPGALVLGLIGLVCIARLRRRQNL